MIKFHHLEQLQLCCTAATVSKFTRNKIIVLFCIYFIQKVQNDSYRLRSKFEVAETGENLLCRTRFKPRSNPVLAETCQPCG